MFQYRSALACMFALLTVPPLFGQQAKEDPDGHIYIAKADGSQAKPLPNLPGYDRQGSPC